MAKGKYQEWLTPEALTKIAGWAKDGLTNDDIAHNIGISKDTFYKWIKEFPDFADSVKVNKEVADRVVENALYKSATGYECDEVSEEFDEDGVLVNKKITHKTITPSVTAIIFWLKNRKPAEWRDKQQLDVTVGGDIAGLLKKRRLGSDGSG